MLEQFCHCLRLIIVQDSAKGKQAKTQTGAIVRMLYMVWRTFGREVEVDDSVPHEA